MSETLIFNRIIAIIETGDYEGDTLGMTGLRAFPDSLDTSAKPPCCLPMERPDSGWQKEGGASEYKVTLSYDLYFYVREAGLGAKEDAKGLAEARELRSLARKIFLARPQLQLSGQSDIAGIVDNILWQNTSNLANSILYPPFVATIQQGAKPYWGFVIRLSIPYREYVKFI